MHAAHLPAEALGGFPASSGASSQLCAGTQATGSESVSSIPFCESFHPVMTQRDVSSLAVSDQHSVSTGWELAVVTIVLQLIVSS